MEAETVVSEAAAHVVSVINNAGKAVLSAFVSKVSLGDCRTATGGKCRANVLPIPTEPAV